MKNKFSIIALSLLIAVGALASVSGIAYATDYCPTSGGLHGWWGSFTPTNRLCSTSYYTYNNVNISSEESWYQTGPLYWICNQPTPPFGPEYYEDIGSRAYIVSPDSSQTHHAQYYRWDTSSDYLLIGIVDQYNTYGWANLSTTWWSFVDTWKLSDATGESQYSKKVDLDAFSITNCP
jgi:hypothetical protein